MSDMTMPSYWVGGMGNAGAGLQNAYASQAQTNAWNNQQANTLAQANSFNPWANSGGSFGAMPAYYAGLGAAYGRSTGGFRGGAGNPSGSVQRGQRGAGQAACRTRLDHRRAAPGGVARDSDEPD
jgi:hypothetical protein